jgi:hypothetical protein
MGNIKALIGLVVLLGALVAGTMISGIWRPWIPRELTPTSVALLGTGGDPNVVMIVFPWTEHGFCPGQFKVTAVETTTRVTVSQVSNKEPAIRLVASCAGVGSDGVSARVELKLAGPLGDREVVRAVDGQQLPVKR